MNINANNPFSVQTPEDITAEEVTSLFVDVFTDYYNVPRTGHTFLNGPRGSGKSMMFRYLLPDCQSLVNKKELKDLDFFSIYIPIKKTELNLTEFDRLERHAQILLNEHLLSLNIVIKVFEALIKYSSMFTEHNEVSNLFSSFKRLLSLSGYTKDIDDINDLSNENILRRIRDINEEIYKESLSYLRKLAFHSEVQPYNGAICGYLDYLLPLVDAVKNVSTFTQGPIYLLIDDADNLNYVQTTVLNTWVSYRTSKVLSLKISTQLNYKTYKTVSGSTIDAPHDYSEVNIDTVYTSNKNKYLERVTEIVKRRLIKSGITTSVEDFFPEYHKQAEAIKNIAREIKDNFEENGRGYSANDDAYRYATSEYIKKLTGASKSGSTFHYAGFEQLVHISSGIVRYFLEPASLMYGEMMKKDGTENTVEHISASVQNKVIREYSEQFIQKEFDKLLLNEVEDKDTTIRVKKLRNLLNALGGAFYAILVSNAAERRVFSIAMSNDLSSDAQEVLNLGIRLGYFQQSTIGNKEGTGRTKLFILSRRLAPYFSLVPTSYAGYKFVTNEALQTAMQEPVAFINRIKQKLEKGQENDVFESTQLNMFN